MNSLSKKKTEIAAGITTFFTMVYIVIVNPAILSAEGTGMAFSGVLTATVFLAFSMTLLMGLYAKLPFAVAPGMGVNAFFAYTIVMRNHVPWPVALGIIFWAGVLFLLCSLTPIRVQIANALPENIRFSAATGIGLFLTFIGLKNAGWVAADPVTFVKLGALDYHSIFMALGLLVMIALLRKKSPFAFLAGIALITMLEYATGGVRRPESFFSFPDFHSVFFKMDILGALKIALLPSILSVFFTDLLDSISTFIGCCYAAGLTDSKGQPLRLREGLIVDSWATLLAGPMGTSSGTAFLESAAGIEVGGRTGFTAVVTALCFLPCFFLAPLAGAVPRYATAPVLILVGAMMFRSVSRIKLIKFEELIPAFLVVVLIPLTFSITQGILWGILAHVLLFSVAGRRKEIPWMLWILAAVSLAMLVIDSFQQG